MNVVHTADTAKAFKCNYHTTIYNDQYNQYMIYVIINVIINRIHNVTNII